MTLVLAAISGCCDCKTCKRCITESAPEEAAVTDPIREQFLLDSLEGKSMLLSPTKVGGIVNRGIAAKYAIIVGAYRDEGNARRKVQACREKGFETDIVDFRNGLHAVTIGHSDSLEEVLHTLSSIKRSSVSPAEPWILTVEE